MSVRSVSGTLRPGYRMLMTLASSGETTYLPKFAPSSAGSVALKKSFFPSGMTTSLTSGLPRRLTWTSRSLPRQSSSRGARAFARLRLGGLGGVRALQAVDLQALAIGARPDPDDGVARVGGRDVLAVACDVGLRDLQGDRVDVVAREIVLAATGVAGAVADVDRVERRPEVHEERVLDLAGEDLAAALQRLDRLRGDGVVVRDRLRPDVVRRDGHVTRDAVDVDQAPALVVVLTRDVVELLDVELRVVDRGDARQRVEERVGIADLGPELEPVADVVVAVARVVDVQVVRRPVVEAVEVRAPGRILERDPVGDDRQRVGRVGRDEGIDVGVVRGGIDRRERSLAVGRA